MAIQDSSSAASPSNDAFNSGKHCSKHDCRTLDFLPLTCPHCQLVYCGSHAPVFYHDCPQAESSAETRAVEKASSGVDPVPQLINSHRPNIPSPKKNDRNAKAKHILATRFPTVVRERQPAPPSKELSPALKLILLKRNAVNGHPNKKDSQVPPGCRWYGSLGCLLPDNDSQRLPWNKQRTLASEPRAIWFDKSTIVGKVFDICIETFRSELISNSHSCSTSDLQLFTVRSGHQKLLVTKNCSATWGDVVGDGEEVWLSHSNFDLPSN